MRPLREQRPSFEGSSELTVQRERSFREGVPCLGRSAGVFASVASVSGVRRALAVVG